MIICEASIPRAAGERRYQGAVILVRMAYARNAFSDRRGTMTIAELFKTHQNVSALVVPDCGHMVTHVDLGPGHVWKCYHPEHSGGIPVPVFAAQTF